MTTTMILAIILGLIVLSALILAFWGVGIYNSLVTLRNRFVNAFGQIDVQLKRRHDLIPNLVESAKGYMAHERGTLEAVIQARSQAVNAEQKAAANPADAGAMRGLMQAETGLGGAMGRFMALFEQYPDLKADQTIADLTEELTSTENKVAFARQAYNDAVMRYNTAQQKVPAVFIAGALGFQPAQQFEIEDAAEREAPKVQF
jgi:LemA protein